VNGLGNKNIYRIKSNDFEKIEDVYGYLKKGFDKYMYNFAVEYKSETEMKFSCEKDTSYYIRKGIDPFHKIKCHIKRIANEENEKENEKEAEFEVEFEVKKTYTFIAVSVLLLSVVTFAISLFGETSVDDIVFTLRYLGGLNLFFIFFFLLEYFNNHGIMKRFTANIKNVSHKNIP
jgi:hypothetical protein